MNILFSKTEAPRDSGIFIPIFAGTIVALILVIGLGLDAGYLFLQKSRLQRAVDAAISNASMLQYQLKSSELSNDEIANNLRDAVLDHLKASFTEMGIDYDDQDLASIQFSYIDCPTLPETTTPHLNTPPTAPPNSDGPLGHVALPKFGVALDIDCNGSLDLEAVVKVNPLVLGVIPGLKKFTYVVATTRGLARHVSLALVLDLSASMFQKRVDADLSAEDCLANPENIGCKRRYQALQDAANKFIENMLPGDTLSLIMFASRAETIVTLRTIVPQHTAEAMVGTGFSPNTVAFCERLHEVDPQRWTKGCYRLVLNMLLTELWANPDFQWRGWHKTNMFAGIRVAADEMSATPSTNPPLKKVMVLISDGAPWGYRRFTATAQSAGPDAPLTLGWNSQWAYTDRHANYLSTLNLSADLRRIAFTKLNNIEQQLDLPDDWAPPPPDPNNPNLEATYPVADRWYREFDRFQEWTGTGPDGVKQIDLTTPILQIEDHLNPNNSQGVINMFHAAINACDSLRIGGGTQIYTLGFGNARTVHPNNDPYERGWQDAEGNIISGGFNAEELKSVLLHRLANHEPDTSLQLPSFPDGVIQNYRDLRHSPRGLFYHARNQAELESSLEAIGKNMRIILKTRKQGPIAFPGL